MIVLCVDALVNKTSKDKSSTLNTTISLPPKQKIFLQAFVFYKRKNEIFELFNYLAPSQRDILVHIWKILYNNKE